MAPFSSATTRPLSIGANVEAQVYALFAVAMACTVGGVYLGMVYAPVLLSTGMSFFFMLLWIALILTSGWWSHQSPLNAVLFIAFPILTGITITPYVVSVLIGYANGATILFNALGATASMSAAAAVLAKLSGWNLSGLGRALFFSVLGLLLFGILQIFVPALRTTGAELWISGIGVLVFSLFTAYDIQRISHLSKMGLSPFLLALSLYLDIFNLFLYVLRFMVAFSGDRR